MKMALTIAGSDPTGGAGLQSDIRVFGRLGVRGLSVATALTAQNTSGVDAIYGIEASFIEAQLNSLLNDIRPDALKTGMLYSKDAIRVIVRVIKGFNLENLVIDPVTVSSSGRPLMEDGVLVAQTHDTIWTKKSYDNFVLDLEFKVELELLPEIAMPDFSATRRVRVENSIALRNAMSSL